MIEIEEATIKINESDLRQILIRVDVFRENCPDVCDDPLPDGDMDIPTFRRLQQDRGHLRFLSGVNSIAIEVVRSEATRNQESGGWYLQLQNASNPDRKE